MTDKLLEVDDLHVEFRTDDGLVQAVRGVSFAVERGQTLGIVGESGSGKSVTNLALMGLIPQPPGRVSKGRALYHGRDLLKLSQRELRSIRGHKIAMIFQDPMTALNPFLTIEEQLTEVTRLHLGLSHAKAIRHAIEMLERVGIPGAAQRVHEYPHQFSGGMRQRVMIAMALSCEPDLLIADEPTTALDVTIQAQILELMKDLQHKQGMAIILITHDLGIVASTCHDTCVMYAGKIVEQAPTSQLFAQPRHPYTLGLMQSMPRCDTPTGGKLHVIEGQPPDLVRLPSGCAFHPRCPYRIERCPHEVPPLFPRHDTGGYACFVDVRTARPHHSASAEVAHG
jgi:oligopeptide transport system ATP-binding protein